MTALWIILYVVGYVISVPLIARWYRRPPGPYSEHGSVAAGLGVGLFWPAMAAFTAVYYISKWLTPLIFKDD